MKMSTIARAGAAMVLLMATGLASAATWDADDDFSILANPNGAWSYGYRVGAGAFIPYASSGTFSGIPFWFFGAGLPDVGKWGPEDLRFHPGNTASLADHASVVRWTAPDAGRYVLSSSFEGEDARGVNTLVSILLNGTSVFSDAITAVGDVATYGATYDLAAADTLEFVVANNGAVGDRNFTQIAAVIATAAVDPPVGTPVAAPGALAVAFGAMLLAARRHRA